VPKTIKIETEHLVLRDFHPGEWKYIHEYASNPLVVRYLPFGPNTLTQTRAYARKILATKRERIRKDFPLAVFSKKEGRIVGGCRLNCQGSTRRDAGLGYVLIRRYWGKGYATEASKALIHFGFSKLKLHRIWATCDVKNAASARVLEKVGMKREGRLHRNVFQNGRWRDSYLYAILEKKSGKAR
jgi:ribosomal-protein-alanine N-acetyltransferase